MEQKRKSIMRNLTSIARLLIWNLVLLTLIGMSALYHGSSANVISAATQAALPPIGNNYPAGPAPTSAPPSGGTAQVTLQVPGNLQSGAFASAHTLTMPPGF